jgi:hypothetical protein
MNRHQRRAARAMGLLPPRSKAERTSLWRSYLRHLPRVPLDAQLAPGTADHYALLHDSWCRSWDTGRFEDCNCELEIARYAEPVRS